MHTKCNKITILTYSVFVFVCIKYLKSMHNICITYINKKLPLLYKKYIIF